MFAPETEAKTTPSKDDKLVLPVEADAKTPTINSNYERVFFDDWEIINASSSIVGHPMLCVRGRIVARLLSDGSQHFIGAASKYVNWFYYIRDITNKGRVLDRDGERELVLLNPSTEFQTRLTTRDPKDAKDRPPTEADAKDDGPYEIAFGPPFIVKELADLRSFKPIHPASTMAAMYHSCNMWKLKQHPDHYKGSFHYSDKFPKLHPLSPYSQVLNMLRLSVTKPNSLTDEELKFVKILGGDWSRDETTSQLLHDGEPVFL